jgi:RimJ/RimL family protein N-acetyltransferase
MVWPRLRRRTFRLPAPGVCAGGRHTLVADRLLLFTPRTQLDAVASIAAAADAEAQRWLGNLADRVVADEDTRRALLRISPSDTGRRLSRRLTEPFELRPDRPEFLVCVRRDGTGYAGGLHLDTARGELGGWLAPGSRGAGLGTELFRTGALLAHTHFGMSTVRAATATANAACRGALARAGFVPDEGPPRHTLPDGRVIDVVWFRHEDERTAHC